MSKDRRNYILMVVLGINDIKYYTSGDADLLDKDTVVVNEVYDSLKGFNIKDLGGIGDIVVEHRDNYIIINNQEYNICEIKYISLVEVEVC